MKAGKQKSVRWRMVLMILVLVFVAMTIVSVFLINRIEDYQMAALEENIGRTVEESNLLVSLGKYDDLTAHSEEVAAYFDSNFGSIFTEELSIVSSDLYVCASTNRNLLGQNAYNVFDAGLIINCLMGVKNDTSESYSANVPIKNLCYAIQSAETGEAIGVVYIRADLTDIENILSNTRILCVQALLIAMAVTIILGVLLSHVITEPIQDLTKAVGRISQGEFSAEDVPVHSKDEIGNLTILFNNMKNQLDGMVAEVYNEKTKLETILTYMADGLVAVDLNGRILHSNPAARKMLGVDEDADMADYSYESLIGHLAPEMEFNKLVASCEKGGEDLVFDYGAITFAVRYDRFKDETGKDIGIIILIQDITERQKLEDMQQDFVANVSHELKTPLTTIKSYTETLLDGAMEDKELTGKFLGIVDSEADRMNRLVKDLLQLSRLDHKQEKWNIKESNLVPLLDVAVTKLEITAQQKQLQLNRLFNADGEIRVLIDRDRFEQVILNIISNAIKYTNEGGRIDVDIYERDGMAKLVVSDTGIGIPAAELPRIFERFYRVDKARSRAMGGTGLGLAITKQIVEEHHGTIDAESKEGRGTRITISLPLAHKKGIRNIE